MGSFSARRRGLVVRSLRQTNFDVQDLSKKQCMSPPSLKMVPLVQSPSPASRVSGTVQLEPTIMIRGDAWLPHPAGHAVVEGIKELVHHPSGAACAFVGVEHPLKGFGGTLVLEAGGTARRLEPLEVARGVEPDLYLSEAKQLGQDKAHLHLAREPGWQYAASVIGFLEHVPVTGKAGNCIDPAYEEAYSQMAVWLRAWRKAPHDTKSQLTLVPRHQAHRISVKEPTAHATPEARCGAAPQRGSSPPFGIATWSSQPFATWIPVRQVLQQSSDRHMSLII